MNSKIIVVVIGLLLLQACASGPKYTPMTQTTRDAIKEVQIYNLVIQDEVKPSVEISQASLALGGGLIGAIIDSSVNKGRSLTAQDIIAPLYDVTEEMNYRKISSDKIYQAIGQEFLIEGQEVETQAVLLNEDDVGEIVGRLEKGKAFVFLSSFYNLINNSRTLSTNTLVFMYMNPEFPIIDENNQNEIKSKSKKKNKPLLAYYNDFSYQSELVGEGGLHSIELWSENNGDLFKKKITESIEQTGSMLMYDLSLTKNESCAQRIKAKLPTVLGSTSIKGVLVEGDKQRKILRNSSGPLLSIASEITNFKSGKAQENCKAEGVENV